MGVIYKITNLINGKIYIGQTVVTEPQRWQAHIWNAYNNPTNDCIYLCNAIKKYGRKNFKREILEEVDTLEELNNREIFYIQKYNSTDPKIGYNICLGGGGHTKYSSEEILELYKNTHSIAQVSKILGSSKDTISKRLRGMGIETYNKTINQYSLDGKLIATFSSFSQAKEKTKLPLPHMVPKHNFSHGYFWVYEKDDRTIEEIIKDYKKSSHLTKKIQQYDLCCNFIREFNSAAEASRELNINVSSIKSALNGKQYTAGGYLWHKADNSICSIEEMYNNYLMSSCCCEIEEIDVYGNVIGRYESSGKFEKQMNWSYNCVKLVCDGKKTHTHGRIFRYANSDKRKLLNEREG